MNNKYWQEVLFVTGQYIVVGWMCRDGLLFAAREEDIRLELSGYPKDKIGWFFNSSKDRYIAERKGEGIVTLNLFINTTMR